MAGKQLGSLTVPVYATLPASAPTGAVGMCAGTFFTYADGRWNQLIPVFFNNTGIPPTGISPGIPYLYVDMSGTEAALYAEDGIVFS